MTINELADEIRSQCDTLIVAYAKNGKYNAYVNGKLCEQAYLHDVLYEQHRQKIAKLIATTTSTPVAESADASDLKSDTQ